MRILLVEDDAMIGKTLQQALQQDGYAVDWVTDGHAARLTLDTAGDAYALVLLDLGLPKKSGLDLLKEIRRAGNKVRVLVVTARDAVADRVAGLDAGGDDYLTKPFSLEELLARMRALLRRTADGSGEALRFADLELDPGTREVRRGGEPIELTRTEFSLLELFMLNPRQVLTRSVIFERVWGYDFGYGPNSLDVYIGYLRRKT